MKALKNFHQALGERLMMYTPSQGDQLPRDQHKTKEQLSGLVPKQLHKKIAIDFSLWNVSELSPVPAGRDRPYLGPQGLWGGVTVHAGCDGM